MSLHYFLMFIVSIVRNSFNYSLGLGHHYQSCNVLAEESIRSSVLTKVGITPELHFPGAHFKVCSQAMEVKIAAEVRVVQ